MLTSSKHRTSVCEIILLNKRQPAEITLKASLRLFSPSSDGSPQSHKRNETAGSSWRWQVNIVKLTARPVSRLTFPNTFEKTAKHNHENIKVPVHVRRFWQKKKYNEMAPTRSFLLLSLFLIQHSRKIRTCKYFSFTRRLRLRCKVQISAFCATGGFRFPHHSHSCTPNTGRKSGIWLQTYLGCSQIALGGLNLKSDFQWARRKLSLWMWKTAFSFQTVYTMTLQHGSVGTFEIRPVPAHSGNPVIYVKRNNISLQSKQRNPKYNYEPAKEQNEFPLYQIQRNPEKKINRKETLIIL